MKIGVVKEIKDKEYRVALTPAGVQALVAAGHTWKNLPVWVPVFLMKNINRAVQRS